MRDAPERPALSPAMHHILLVLLEGRRHGYAIMQAVERITGGSGRMGPGTLYGAIKRLLEAGLVEETDEPAEAGEERRRYYRLTGAGRAAVRLETERLQRLVAFASEHLRTAALPA